MPAGADDVEAPARAGRATGRQGKADKCRCAEGDTPPGQHGPGRLENFSPDDGGGVSRVFRFHDFGFPTGYIRLRYGLARDFQWRCPET
jgi:hypothetical protein